MPFVVLKSDPPMGLATKEDTMRDTDQQFTDDEPERPTHWIERLCASAWVRLV
jgi:hypothetical protein